MRFLTPFLTLITTTSALALPFPLPIPQFGSSTSSTADDVKNNVGCRAVTVIFARGTSEPGNIGRVIGPPLRDALKVCLSYPSSLSTYLPTRLWADTFGTHRLSSAPTTSLTKASPTLPPGPATPTAAVMAGN